jgi:hypothetical protein
VTTPLLATLTKPLTPAEVEANVYAGIATLGISTTDWKTGGPTRTTITLFAIVIAACTQLIALIAGNGFLSTSRGPWLEVLARENYNVEKGVGTFAEGAISATNASGFAYAGGAGDLVVRNPTTNKTYASTGAWAIGPLAVGVSIPVQATEIGAASTSSGGAVTALVTALSGVTITNPTAIVGSDPPSDPTLRQECLDKTASLSPNGAPGAYRFVATTAKRVDGSSIGVTRVRTIPDGIFGIDAYYADGTGTVSGPDLARIDELEQTQVVPEGVTLRSHAATPKVVSPTWQLWIRNTSGLSSPEIKTIVDAALVAYLANVIIGGETLNGTVVPGKVFITALEGVISRAVDVAIGNTGPTLTVRVVVTVPGVDVVVAFNEATVMGVSTGVVTQVSEAV